MRDIVNETDVVGVGGGVIVAVSVATRDFVGVPLKLYVTERLVE